MLICNECLLHVIVGATIRIYLNPQTSHRSISKDACNIIMRLRGILIVTLTCSLACCDEGVAKSEFDKTLTGNVASNSVNRKQIVAFDNRSEMRPQRMHRVTEESRKESKMDRSTYNSHEERSPISQFGRDVFRLPANIVLYLRGVRPKAYKRKHGKLPLIPAKSSGAKNAVSYSRFYKAMKRLKRRIKLFFRRIKKKVWH